MALIMAKTDEIINKSEEILKISSDAKKILSKMNYTILNLAAVWRGQAQDTMALRYENNRQQAEKFIESLEEYAKLLKSKAERFAEIENQTVRTFNGVAGTVPVGTIISPISISSIGTNISWIEKESNENLKSLQTNDPATKLKIQEISKGGNDYSNYSVIDGFNPDYIYDQHDKWTDSKGKTYNGSSTCCQGVAIAIGKSLKNKEMVQPGVGVPDYTYPATGKYCTQKLKGKPAQQKYNEIYKQLSAGNPVMITLNGYSKGADTHFVTCVGLSNEAIKKYGNNPDFSQVNIQPQDILVADPADGKIKKLSECKSQVRDTGSIFVFDK